VHGFNLCFGKKTPETHEGFTPSFKKGIPTSDIFASEGGLERRL
jgi:hypothetical protein